MKYLAQAKERIKLRRQEAEAKLAEKMQQLRLANPDFYNAERKLHSLCFEKARLDSQNADLGKLNEKIARAKQNFNNELVKLGLSEKDLQACYHCAICQDTGEADSKICTCLKKEIASLIAGAQDGRVTKQVSFESNFSIFGKNVKEYQTNYALINKFANDYPNVSTKKIIFCGKSGTGKSYLASILANELEQKLHEVIFIKAVRLNNLFLEYHLAPLEKKADILSDLFSCKMLIIDDLGSENFLNNVTSEYLYQLITEREQIFTLITTNLTPEQINDTYGSRVFSRLADKAHSIWLRFDCNDLRLK